MRQAGWGTPPGKRTDWLRTRAMMQAESDLYYISALIIGVEGEIIGRYPKRHPAQFFAGTALGLTHNGAEFLVVPTCRAREWGPIQQMQHARPALARVAETSWPYLLFLEH